MRILLALLVAAMLGSGSAAAQPVACEQELRQLRWLVQKYGSDRTTLEFALAASEGRRQAAEERLRTLEDAMKSAPKGQK